MAVLLISGCARIERLPREPAAEDSVMRITLVGRSKDIREEAMQAARGYCEKQDGRFKFIKNVFRTKRRLGVDFVSCDLFFSCRAVDEKETAKPGPTEKAGPGATETEALEKESVEATGGAPGEAEHSTGKDADAGGRQNTIGAERPDISETGLGKPESLGFEKNISDGSKKSSTPQDSGLIVEEVIEK